MNCFAKSAKNVNVLPHYIFYQYYQIISGSQTLGFVAVIVAYRNGSPLALTNIFYRTLDHFQTDPTGRVKTGDMACHEARSGG